MIVNTIISCIEQEIPGVADFLELRFKKIKTMPTQIQNELREEAKFTLQNVVYGAVIATCWSSTEDLQKRMYQDSGVNSQYNNYIYDLPGLHTESESGKRFIEALDNLSDISFFSKKSV